MTVTIGRRELLVALGGAAAAWPLAARAQQPAMPVIGLLYGGSSDAFGYLLTAIRRGLRESGYIEGRNVAIEFRWAEDRYDRVPGAAAGGRHHRERRRGLCGKGRQGSDGDDPDRLHYQP